MAVTFLGEGKLGLRLRLGPNMRTMVRVAVAFLYRAEGKYQC